MKNVETDKKIVFLVEHALATQNAGLLYNLSVLLEKRSNFERKLEEITGAQP